MRALGGSVFFAALLAAGASSAQVPAADAELWSKIDNAMSSIQQIKYTLVKQERLAPDKDLLPEETFLVKYRKPYDIYMDVIGGPNIGRHIMYRSGWDTLKVHVFSRAFQWMVPKVPVISQLALNGNHHSIMEAAFDNTIATIKANIVRNEQLRKADPSHPAIQVDPMKEVVVSGKPSYYYRSVTPELYTNYTTTADDKTVFDIAKKVDNAWFVVMYYNSDKISRYDRIKPGMQLKIPVYYGKISEFWVDQKTFLIWRIRISDFNGKVYEEFTHLDMTVGAAAGLSDKDFDPTNPDFGF